MSATSKTVLCSSCARCIRIPGRQTRAGVPLGRSRASLSDAWRRYDVRRQLADGASRGSAICNIITATRLSTRQASLLDQPLPNPIGHATSPPASDASTARHVHLEAVDHERRVHKVRRVHHGLRTCPAVPGAVVRRAGPVAARLRSGKHGARTKSARITQDAGSGEATREGHER